jgi:hypothetical protein
MKPRKAERHLGAKRERRGERVLLAQGKLCVPSRRAARSGKAETRFRGMRNTDSVAHKRVATTIFIVIILAALIYTLDLTGPTWTPTTPFTNNTLNCSWTASGDTIAQNITVLRNGAVFSTTYENASEVSLSSTTSINAASTAKGELWTCRITLHNGTVSIVQETNVTILNSPPTIEGGDAGIFNSSNQDVGTTVHIMEDTTIILDVNATDPDGDTITYLDPVPSTFCSLLSAAEGTYSCSPTQSQITGNQPTLRNVSFLAEDGANFGGRKITFNITPVNDAPVLTLADQTTPVNQSLNYTFTATDEENSFPLTYTLTAPAEIAGKLSLTKLNTDGTSMSLFYNAATPDFTDVGAWTVEINVTDNSSTLGIEDSRSMAYNITLNITAVGRSPYFTLVTSNVSNSSGPYNISQGQSIQINISANDPDENTQITFLVNTNRFNLTTIKNTTTGGDARAQVNYTPTNDHVGLFNVTVTIRDNESITNTTILQFNVSNINDIPTVHEISYSPSNTQDNQNMSNLTAYANTPFIYDVNATDPDTPYGDTLNYSDNTTLFTINATTGRIMFTPSDSDVAAGAYHINITATDQSGANSSRTIILTIRENNPPYFTASLPTIGCTTKANCTFDISAYVDDPDAGDSVASYNITGTQPDSFMYNTSTGLINFTVLKTDVGNYTLSIMIEDTHGATNSTTVNLTIVNTPEAPNLTRYNFSGMTIVETYLFTYELQATDEDFLVPSAMENLTFATNLSLANSLTPLSTANTTARALLSFTPDLGDAGDYSITINVTDAQGQVSQRVVNFTIYPKVPAPNITNITPWGLPPLYTLQTTYNSTLEAQLADGIADVTLSENTTAIFATIVVDSRPLTYNWTVNGTTVSTSQNYTRNFDYNSAGRYIVRLNVSNDRFEHSIYTWDARVQNVNRPPLLISSLNSPLTVNGTVMFSNYFVESGGTKFIDPDDDLNSNYELDGTETNTLTFSTNFTCNVATFTFSGADLTVSGVQVGSCIVEFMATDNGGLRLGSDSVSINVTDIIQGDTTTTPTSSGGGGGRSSPTFIPISRDKEKPQAFNLIAPKLVTIHNNKSLDIPIIINNTWKDSLKLVQLRAESNVSNMTLRFDTDFFEEIPKNESREVILTIENYRFGSNYEVKVIGNVSDPQYGDSALILLNSIEQTQDGSDANVRVTFANDLVKEHPECQELEEVLEQARSHIDQGDFERGKQLVEGVINGCKYLVSTQTPINEKPSRLNPIINIDDISVKSMMLGVLAFVVLSSIAFIIYYHYSHKPEDDI